MSDSLQPHGLYEPTMLLRPWDFPGKSTGVGCHFLLQRIFPTQGSNPGLPHCRQMLYHLSHQGSVSFPVTHTPCLSSLCGHSSPTVMALVWVPGGMDSKQSHCLWALELRPSGLVLPEKSPERALCSAELKAGALVPWV